MMVRGINHHPMGADVPMNGIDDGQLPRVHLNIPESVILGVTTHAFHSKMHHEHCSQISPYLDLDRLLETFAESVLRLFRKASQIAADANRIHDMSFDRCSLADANLVIKAL